jgi:hypothetical protein
MIGNEMARERIGDRLREADRERVSRRRRVPASAQRSRERGSIMALARGLVHGRRRAVAS